MKNLCFPCGTRRKENCLVPTECSSHPQNHRENNHGITDKLKISTLAVSHSQDSFVAAAFYTSGTLTVHVSYNTR